MKYILELKKVNKIYNVDKKEIKTLNNLDLKIKEGDFVVVTGPSGSGKTELLNIIGGLDKVNSGKILIDQENISEYKEDELTELRAQKMMYILKTGNLLPTLTVKENVEMITYLTGEKIDVDKWLDKVKLLKSKNKFVHHLTPLEQQKVAFARAFAKNASILLCNNPTEFIASKDVLDIAKLLKEYHGKGKDKKTIIMITDNILFEQVADVVVKMKNGKIEKTTRLRKKKKVEDISW